MLRPLWVVQLSLCALRNSAVFATSKFASSRRSPLSRPVRIAEIAILEQAWEMGERELILIRDFSTGSMRLRRITLHENWCGKVGQPVVQAFVAIA